ncbi:MAG: CYTH domain-containing protein [Marinobacter sp.]|uniref:CYTH domain-containing protein n=1 Tax=Marinobacter sp. TaxID=50741 RepID=UPI00299DB43E|nr:CYTH domain-containing protein [Marinobacter sp.]MDX1756781.1 CYTH domain-containing protein [Marinobacter sp.]
MPQELEIKLTLTPAAQESAYQWLTALPTATVGSAKTLINTYFDTPAAALNRQRAALRVRQTGDGYIQTLKTQGEFVNGAHRRQEWEWPLGRAELELDLLADTPLVRNIDLTELSPVFETNFERRVVMLDDGDAVIECAFDTGQINAGDKVMPLCELEFELKSGDETRLLHWACQLAAQVPFFLNLISKAEQGYHLAGLHEPEPLPRDAEPVNRFFHGLSVLWLTGEATGELRGAMGDVASLLVDLAASELKERFEAFRANPDPSWVGQMGALQLGLLQSVSGRGQN